MRTVFTYLLCFIMFQLQGQTVTKYYDYLWKECEPINARFYGTITKTDSGFIRKDYFIHNQSLQMLGKYEDFDCEIKNGFFYYFHSNGVLQSMGQYIHNKKEGLWLGYHNNKMMRDSAFYIQNKIVGIGLSWYSNGMPEDSTTSNSDGTSTQVTWFDNGSPSSAGIYSVDGKQIGKWQYFHKNGKLSSEENYTNGKLIEKKYFDEEGNLQAKSKSKAKDAEFPGGSNAWMNYILSKLYFPENYQFVNGDKAVVVISFSVSENGTVENVFVKTPFYPEFDKIAEKVISESPKWEPAIDHNRKVQFWFNQPVTFAQIEE